MKETPLSPHACVLVHAFKAAFPEATALWIACPGAQQCSFERQRHRLAKPCNCSTKWSLASILFIFPLIGGHGGGGVNLWGFASKSLYFNLDFSNYDFV